MNSRSLTTTRLAAAALVLLLAVLACNLPIQTPNSAPVEIDVPPAEEMDPPSEVLVSPEDVPSPEVVPPLATESLTTARIPGLQPGTTLVWWLSTYNLVIDRPGGELQTLALQIPITSNLGMPAEMRVFRHTDAGLGITRMGEASAGMDAFLPGMILIGSDGEARQVAGPASDGALVGAAWSPDGARIAWLYDVTFVEPNPFDPEACTEAAGCVGRVYDLFLTDSSGGSAQTILTHVVNQSNFPHLQISHWRSDSAALFLIINSKLPSNLYRDAGDVRLQVDIPSGLLTDLGGNYSGTSTFISPDGRWLAWNADIDHQVALRTVGPDGVPCELPFTAGKYHPLAFSLQFSPDSSQLVWLDLMEGEDNTADRLDGIAVRRMALGSCAPATLLELGQPLWRDDLPHLTGWLNDTLLMVSTHHDTRVLDTSAATWVDFEWPMLADPATLAGAVGP